MLVVVRLRYTFDGNAGCGCVKWPPVSRVRIGSVANGHVEVIMLSPPVDTTSFYFSAVAT